MKRLTQVAIMNSLLIAILFFITNNFIVILFWMFMVFMFFQLFSYGLLIGNLSALAMQPLGHITGLGASIVGAISTLIAVPLSIIIGSYYNDSTLPIAIGFFVIGIISVLLINYVNRIKSEK